jgi:hypothetical protein
MAKKGDALDLKSGAAKRRESSNLSPGTSLIIFARDASSMTMLHHILGDTPRVSVIMERRRRAPLGYGQEDRRTSNIMLNFVGKIYVP